MQIIVNKDLLSKAGVLFGTKYYGREFSAVARQFEDILTCLGYSFEQRTLQYLSDRNGEIAGFVLRWPDENPQDWPFDRPLARFVFTHGPSEQERSWARNNCYGFEAYLAWMQEYADNFPNFNPEHWKER